MSDFIYILTGEKERRNRHDFGSYVKCVYGVVYLVTLSRGKGKRNRRIRRKKKWKKGNDSIEYYKN